MTRQYRRQPVRPRTDRPPRCGGGGRGQRHRQAALLVIVFIFAGASAAIAGGLFAGLQTYITPDAFTFDLSLLFFIAILIGGRGSILGPCSAPSC
jgi:hypothetical protein